MTTFHVLMRYVHCCLSKSTKQKHVADQVTEDLLVKIWVTSERQYLCIQNLHKQCVCMLFLLIMPNAYPYKNGMVYTYFNN